MALGPVQILVIGFADPDFRGEILPELTRLSDDGVVRLVDLLAVVKDPGGTVSAIEASELSDTDAAEFGAVAGALIGLGADGPDGAEAGAIAGAAEMATDRVFSEDDVWYAADVIPPGSAAAIAILEHRWAIPLRDAVVRAGGEALASEWLHPADLVALGMEMPATATR